LPKTPGWLQIEERESVDMRLYKPSIVAVWKHFLESRGRSFLHSEIDCPLCPDYGPPRLRYQAKVIANGQNLNWEYGAEAYQAIQAIADQEGWIRILVTRLCKGRRTTYQVVQGSDTARELTKYTIGKYGHMVRQ